MDRVVITPRIRLGESVKSKVRSSVYGSIDRSVYHSVWESMSSPVDISVRSLVIRFGDIRAEML